MLTKLKKIYLTLGIFLTPLLSFADAGDVDTSKLRTGIGALIGVMYLVGFVWSIIVVWGGVKAKKKGDEDAYNSMIAGLWIPAGIIVVAIFFTVLGLGEAVEAANFDWG
jgi:hypothetical protein